MHLKYSAICALIALHFSCIAAYPTLFLPAHSFAYKRSELGFPQVDADVLELEHLRSAEVEADDVNAKLKRDMLQQPTDLSDVVVVDETLPKLEHELETAAVAAAAAAANSATTVSTTTASSEQKIQTNDGNAEQSSVLGPITIKPFYGAARLAFGQNPEVLPTLTSSTTTSTSSSTTTATTTTATSSSNDATKTQLLQEPIVIEPTTGAADIILATQSNSDAVVTNTAEETSLEKSIDMSTTLLAPAFSNANATNDSNKETVSDVLTAELKDNKAVRRSIGTIFDFPTPKMAENLLRHPNGQYSSFDMAQYVFWTGDEAGVARAVEEFIEQGLMSRENALKFLRDIRLGIEYLERSYANRAFPNELRQNYIKKNIATTTVLPTSSTTTSTTTTSTTTTTEKPLPLLQDAPLIRQQKNARNLIAHNAPESNIWNKLQALNNNDMPQELPDYSEATGRAKIAEFLHSEYTLEEILYKLAKVMFAQSLAHGSDEAQKELQKLTDFLEREGNLGVIPIDLQKKVLHVLLLALSDTLTEHPELLPAARSNLVNPYNRLQLQAYGLQN